MEFTFPESLIVLFSVITVLFLLLRAYVVLTAGKCKLKTRLDGKIVIVTGSNSGKSLIILEFFRLFVVDLPRYGL